MKKIALLILTAAMITACGNRQSANTQERDRASLETELREKDSILNDVFSSINQIAENLSSIKAREGIVTANMTGDLSKEKRAQINEDITAINELLIQNKANLERLKGSTEKLRIANVRIQELENLVANLNKQVTDKDADIVVLKDELSRLRIQVTELSTTVDSLHTNVNLLAEDKSKLESTVSEQSGELNTVYYIIGSERDLMDAAIVEKSGFIGRTLKMSSNYDLEKFTRIDRRGLEKIIVGKKKITLVTPHPTDSYELEMSDSNTTEAIVILDPVKFWESSKVLVISYK